MTSNPSGPTTASGLPTDPGFTALDLAKKALEIAEANPDYVYPSGDCVYVEDEHDEKGSCLFGQALIALGVWPETLDAYYDTNIVGVLDDMDVHHPKRAFLEAAQMGQDAGAPWGSDDVAGYLRTYIREAS